MKKAEGQAKSSIAMQKSSCMRFLSYLDRSGVTDCSMITPQIVTGFHACDHHRTIEGKNAYSVRVRQFIDFLAEQGLVTSTLRLAIPTNSAKATRIIEVLTAEEREAIDQYRSSASTPMELRNIAMVSLGYRMGLRCTDVVGVRLRDIRWQTQTIAIVQQKTGYPVTLPMPTDVANCLYNYIMHGRPESASEHLFIAMRVPFGALNRTVCAKALNTVLQQQGKVRGFHITRRTFASRMLAHHVPFDTISDALGHRQRETVFSYLATDEGGLRGCAIRLSAIPQDKGGQRW